MRIAIIDLGTNTFNLLIVEKINSSHYNILLNTKEGVKLGEGGINRRFITEAASQRGIDAIKRHYERMAEFKPDKIVAFATSAIRDAENGPDFAHKLKSLFNLDINIINGEKEAELIYLGVKQTLMFTGKKFVILDIGGGSNEFIIADDNGILWKHSFPLGMARLLDRFKPSNPINKIEIETIESYLESELELLFSNLDKFKPEVFVGASGSFDSFILMLSNEGLINHTPGDISHVLPLDIFNKIYQRLINSTSDERDKMKGLEPVRRDMIVLAAIFVNFVFKKARFQTIYQSAFSLKEGAVWEIINQE